MTSRLKCGMLFVLATTLFFVLTGLMAFSRNKPVLHPAVMESTCNDNGIAKKPTPRQMKNAAILPTVCSDEGCKSDYIRHFVAEELRSMPTIRHIIWVNESVSRYFAEHLRSWQAVHPNWRYVLWRDEDLVPFVARHFRGFLAKFESLPMQIMRVDMIRYMLLFKYGGVYADLDYSLVGSLEDFRRYPAVVTREPEAHSIHVLGMSWPVRPLLSPAFMMASPGHIFHRFVVQQLLGAATDKYAIDFAGPIGLTNILETYSKQFPSANHPMEAVYLPPSYSFYPYPNNRMGSSNSSFLHIRFSLARTICSSLMSSNNTALNQLKLNPNLTEYCMDVDNMDPITDKTQPVFAIHDLGKPGPFYSSVETDTVNYIRELVPMRSVLNYELGRDWM